MIISNGNKTEWSPIQSVIIRVITKSDNCTVKSDLSIMSMITDQIGRQKTYYQLIIKLQFFENSQVKKETENLYKQRRLKHYKATVPPTGN